MEKLNKKIQKYKHILPLCSETISGKYIEQIKQVFLEFREKYIEYNEYIFKHFLSYLYINIPLNNITTTLSNRLSCYKLLCYFCPFITSTHTLVHFTGFYNKSVFLFQVKNIKYSTLQTLHIIPLLSKSQFISFKNSLYFTNVLYNHDHFICPNILTFNKTKEKQYIHNTDQFGSYVTSNIEQTFEDVLKHVEKYQPKYIQDKCIDILYILIQCNYYNNIVYNDILKPSIIGIKENNACFFNFMYTYNYDDFESTLNEFTNNNVLFLNDIKPFFKYLFFLQYDDFINTYIDKKYRTFYINEKITYIQKIYNFDIDKNQFLTKLHLIRTSDDYKYNQERKNLKELILQGYNNLQQTYSIDIYTDKHTPFLKTIRYLYYFHVYNEFIFTVI